MFKQIKQSLDSWILGKVNDFDSEKTWQRVLFLVIFGLGIFARLYNFPNNPPGLNHDEAAASYEAYSLLKTGMDKWGNVLPVYFVAWGSGQSVLYSYLSIPFMHFFGLNLVTIRIVNLLTGILNILFLYLLVKDNYGYKKASLAALILAVTPWGIMSSRWGLEANLLPFCLLFSIFILNFAIKPKFKFLIPLAFLPLFLSVYAYALAFPVICIIFLGFLWNYKKEIWKNKFLWLSSCIFGFLVFLPFLVFFAQNNIFNQKFAFTDNLPIQIPLLPINRLTQANDEGLAFTLAANLYFFVTGMPDFLTWNTSQTFLPLSFVVFPFSFIGFWVLFQKYRKDKILDWFLLWFLASLPLIFITPLNQNRGNSFFIPMIVLAVFGVQKVFSQIKTESFQNFFILSFVGWLIAYFAVFYTDYTLVYPKRVAYDFHYELDKAIVEAEKISSNNQKIYLTTKVSINYVYPLVYKQVDPQDFRQNVVYSKEAGNYQVKNWRNWYFIGWDMDLKEGEKFSFIQKQEETNLCKNPEILWQTKLWKVGTCVETKNK